MNKKNCEEKEEKTRGRRGSMPKRAFAFTNNLSLALQLRQLHSHFTGLQFAG
jgi:hypothetical protein